MYIDKFYDIETKIYSLQELQDINPTVEDIDYFINSPSLYLSMTVAMFKFCGISEDDAEILDICRTDPAFYKEYTWTKEQRSEFEHIMTKIFMKCLDMSKEEAYHEITTWNAMGTAFDLEDYSNDYYKSYLKLVEDLSANTNTVHKINLTD